MVNSKNIKKEKNVILFKVDVLIRSLYVNIDEQTLINFFVLIVVVLFVIDLKIILN